MIVAVIQILDPHPDWQAVKEDLAMYCERFGDLRPVQIREVNRMEKNQMRIRTGLEEDQEWQLMC